MLRTRLLAAVPILLGAYGLLWWDAYTARSWGILLLFGLLSVLALREFYAMVRAQGAAPFALFGGVMALLLLLAHEQWCWETYHGAPAMTPNLLWTALAAAALVPFLLQCFRRTPEGTVRNVGATLLGLVYLWLLPSFMHKMRHLGLRHGWAYDGVEFLLLCFCIAKISDVGGYLVGSKLGRHKLIPWLSPKKTWEGLAGGVAASTAMLLLMATLAPASAIATLGWARLGGLGVLLGFAALGGDLVESAIKRDSAVKDAGASVPGFGGVLDLVDSLMVAGPAMYFYLLWCGAEGGWQP